jgi:hypothetical protein
MEKNKEVDNLSNHEEGQISDRVFHLNDAAPVHDISKITDNTNVSPTKRPFIKNKGLTLKDDVEFEVKEVKEPMSKNDSNNISLVSENHNYVLNLKNKIDSGKILEESGSKAIEINYSKPQNEITLRDYMELSAKEVSVYDNRGFFTLLTYSFLLKHKLLNLFFKISILDPLWKRIVVLFSFINFLFTFNALFFTDDLIDYRANFAQSVRVKIFFNYFQTIRILTTSLLLKNGRKSFYLYSLLIYY